MNPPPIDTSIPRKEFPKWTIMEQDLWIDLLDSYSQVLISARVDPERQMTRGEITQEQLEGDITMGALLADRAIQEMQYRFEIQKRSKRRAKRKTSATKTRKRA